MKTVSPYVPLFVLPVVSVVTAAVAAVNHGAVRVYWILGTVAVTAGTALYNALKERRGRRLQADAIEAKARLATALTSSGEPLIAALGRVSAADTPAKRDSAIDVLRSRIVDVARTQCGTGTRTEIRSVFYAFDSAQNLKRSEVCGREYNAARPQFLANHDDHDSSAIAIARGEKAVLVEDLPKSPPAGFEGADSKSYKTFISVPVRAGDRSYGLLTVDSPEAGSLTKVDRGYMILLAGLLGAGLAQATTGRAPPNGTGTASTAVPNPRENEEVRGHEPTTS